MILGFENNLVSSLASDITSTQTTFAVFPGEGARFSRLLTSDYSNPSSPHSVYAKITLTDKQESVFEICHLTSVSQDLLTVVRACEGTTAKGWSLNDVVGNFATRGSESTFVQIEHIQGGDYTGATAGGTANALTISLPSTYQNNSSSDWAIKTPLMITPIATNTGAVTIQLTLAGKVVGMFPAYKGNKAELQAGDILVGAPFLCVMDANKAFFSVLNPVKIYGSDEYYLKALHLQEVKDEGATAQQTLRGNIGCGTVATKDVVTSDTDSTAGRIPTVNWAVPKTRKVNDKALSEDIQLRTQDIWGRADSITEGRNINQIMSPGLYYIVRDDVARLCSGLPEPNAQKAGELEVLEGEHRIQVYRFTGTPRVYYRLGTGNNTWQGWVKQYDEENKPSATELGVVQANGGTHNVGPHRIAIDWGVDGKLWASVDDIDQGEFYTSKNPPPAPSLSGYIAGDACNTAGFASRNPADPYMRNVDNGEIVLLARRDWVVSGSRQASLMWSGAIGGGAGFIAPAGCVLVGARNNGSSDVANMGVAYVAEQICINGQWVTIGRV